MDPTIVFLIAFMTLLVLEGVKYMAWKLLSITRNNIMACAILGDHKLCSLVKFFGEIINDLHGRNGLKWALWGSRLHPDPLWWQNGPHHWVSHDLKPL